MDAAVVIPCYNEAATLEATCASLGFVGSGPPAPDATLLVLVDNGSSDRTSSIMAQLRDAAPDRIVVTAESERGYVPPRRRGVDLAGALLAARGRAPQETLIVQADADTIYGPDYVQHLLSAASSAVPGTLLEGVATPPTDFVRSHPGFHRLAEQADEAVEPFLVDESDEVVMDDQVAAFRLSDYTAWGGHQREYDLDGDEIHAETSRLYMRGRILGASRRRVPEARAMPSRRKVEAAPLLYFATTGFPQAAAWRAQWNEPTDVQATFAEFEQPTAATTFAREIALRQAYTLLLFGVVPAFIQWRLGRVERRNVLQSRLGDLVPALTHIGAAEIVSRPGVLLSEALRLIDQRPHVFEQVAQGLGGAPGPAALSPPSA